MIFYGVAVRWIFLCTRYTLNSRQPSQDEKEVKEKRPMWKETKDISVVLLRGFRVLLNILLVVFDFN